jgi:uncharacterized membrane protein YhaH (DUF805 family)
MEWMLMPYRRYFDFSGRSRRLEYWMFFLFLFLVGIVFNILAMTFGFSAASMMGMSPNGVADPSAVFQGLGAGFWGIMALYMLFALATLIPQLAVNVRRLHDRNMSGWFLLLFFVLLFIPFINFLAMIAYLVLMCLEGTKGPNRFGPDPLDPAGVEAFS